jgi:hypothetical protein
MTTRLKRAQAAHTEAETAAEAAFLDMGAAELAWLHAKMESGPWTEWEERDARRKACLRDVRRARNTFRKHLREVIEARNDIERLTEDRERRQAVALRSKQRQQRRATVAEIAASAGAELMGMM